MGKYHYLVLFLIGYLVLWPVVLHKLYIEQKKNTEAFVAKESVDFIEETEIAGEPERADSGSGEVSGNEVFSGNGTVSGAEAAMDNSGISEAGTAVENGEISEAETVSGSEPASGSEAGEEGVVKAPEEEGMAENREQPAGVEESSAGRQPSESFFQDALFIGDSRTMGLSEYADLNNAVVFANTGMNIYRLYTLKNGVRGQEVYLEDILKKKQYRKIYLMLGINELGYDEAQTMKRFEEEVLKLREYQPGAKIVLEANLHVTTARSARDKIFNNAGIDRINADIRKIAEQYGLSYIDVNQIFDDETGGLASGYTHDEVHVLGKYYQRWADWIKETGV